MKNSASSYLVVLYVASIRLITFPYHISSCFCQSVWCPHKSCCLSLPVSCTVVLSSPPFVLFSGGGVFPWTLFRTDLNERMKEVSTVRISFSPLFYFQHSIFLVEARKLNCTLGHIDMISKIICLVESTQFGHWGWVGCLCTGYAWRRRLHTWGIPSPTIPDILVTTFSLWKSCNSSPCRMSMVSILCWQSDKVCSLDWRYISVKLLL